MAADRSFEELMARLQAGDDDAAAEVFHHFAHRLRALARSRLAGLLRPKVDPEDVLQSVYRSFFCRHAQGDFAVDSWDGLWGLLTLITLRKCGYRLKYFRAGRRDIRREADLTPPGGDAGAEFAPVARDPHPSEAVLLTETVEQLMRDLDEREREILALSLQGHSVAEISAQVGRTERTVQRVLKRVRTRLEEMHAEHFADP